ncbi:hypothetical protein BGZ76_009550 [Entomortierella beljakovae]|nr:hypothetical protein BGZ76_009550 [Entomortierella beljakovae]
MVFTWRFYIQTGITIVLTFYFIFSTIAFYIHRRNVKRMTYYQPRSMAHSIISLFEMVVVVGLSGGLLYVTIPALVGKNRTAFLVPFNRDSAQDNTVNGDYRRYDPMNLYQCPESTDDVLTMLCSFDRCAITAACGVGAFAIIGSIFVLIYKLTPLPQSQWSNNYGELDRSEPIPLTTNKQDV